MIIASKDCQLFYKLALASDCIKMNISQLVSKIHSPLFQGVLIFETTSFMPQVKKNGQPQSPLVSISKPQTKVWIRVETKSSSSFLVYPFLSSTSLRVILLVRHEQGNYSTSVGPIRVTKSITIIVFGIYIRVITRFYVTIVS